MGVRLGGVGLWAWFLGGLLPGAGAEAGPSEGVAVGAIPIGVGLAGAEESGLGVSCARSGR